VLDGYRGSVTAAIALGWTFLAGGAVLFVHALRLDRKLQHDLPPVLLRHVVPPSESAPFASEIATALTHIMEALPVRWQRELFAVEYRAAIDRFWFAMLCAWICCGLGGVLLSTTS